MGICIEVKSEKITEPIVIGCSASSEHLMFLESFVRKKTGEEFNWDNGKIKTTVKELWNELKKWAVFYLQIDDIEGASKILFSMENLKKIYVEDRDLEALLVWC